MLRENTYICHIWMCETTNGVVAVSGHHNSKLYTAYLLPLIRAVFIVRCSLKHHIHFHVNVIRNAYNIVISLIPWLSCLSSKLSPVLHETML